MAQDLNVDLYLETVIFHDSMTEFSSFNVSSFLFFGLLGFPLIWQDLRDNSISSKALFLVIAVWWVSSLLTPDPAFRLATSAGVLMVGGFLLFLLPGRLGEADVLFISGMACLFSFWSLIFSVALGCVGALALYLWLSRGGREVVNTPIPFLPCLYWGGLTVALGGLVS